MSRLLAFTRVPKLFRKRTLPTSETLVYFRGYCSSSIILNSKIVNRKPLSRHLATAAHNYILNEAPASSVDANSQNKDISSVENGLREIDEAVRRTGRTYRNQVENIFSLILNQGHATNTQSLYLLRCCGLMRDNSPKRRVEFADIIWTKLQNIGTKFDIGHFNALLKVYVDCSHTFLLSDFLTSMEALNIEPNQSTLLYLLEKSCNDGDLNAASEILEQWKDKGYPLNEAVMCLLIKGHLKVNDIAGAEKMFETMRSSNLAQTADCYIALACGHAERGDINMVQSLINNARNENIEILNSHYISLISAFASGHHINCVNELLESMDNIDAWKQELINLSLELVHKDLDDVAYKLILASYNPQNTNSTNIFVKQLIKTEKPIEKILSYCEDIYKKGMNDIIFLNAAKAATEYGMFDYTVSIYEKMKQLGFPVRSHYFRPMIVHSSAPLTSIWWTLSKMCELGVPVDPQTYTESVFPLTSSMNVEDVLMQIKNSGQSIFGAIDTLFQYYCYHGKFDSAFYLAKNYSVAVRSDFNMKRFLKLYGTFERNPTQYLQMLCFIVNNIGNSLSDEEVIKANCLVSILKLNAPLFEELCKYKQKISNFKRIIDSCRHILSKDSPELLVHLGNIESLPEPQKNMSMEEEESELNYLKDKGRPTVHFLVKRLNYHMEARNTKRVYAIKSKMDSSNIVLPPTSCSQLFSFMCSIEDLKSAEKLYIEMKENYPNFKLDTAKIIDYVTLLIKYSNLDDARKVITEDCRELHIFSSKNITLKSIKRLFAAALESGNHSLVKLIQDSLIIHAEDFKSKDIFLESTIKIHLYRGDLQQAIVEFKNCVKNFNATPCLSILLKKCINADDHIKLETVVDVAASCSGKSLVLQELIMAFIDTGRMQQAIKVVENFGAKKYQNILEDICKELYSKKRVSDLEQFLLSIPKMKEVNLSELFHHLFAAYALNNDFKRAEKLLQLLKDEWNYEPSMETAAILSTLLPNSQFTASSCTNNQFQNNKNIEDFEEHKIFVESLKSEDISTALDILNRMKKGHIKSLSFDEMRDFIHLATRKNVLHGLSNNVQAMSYIIENANDILKPFMEKLSEAGEVEAMNSLSSFLPEFTLQKINFKSFLFKAYKNGNLQEDFLNKLERAKDGNSKLFNITAFEELLRIPALTNRAIELAKKYTETNFHLPITTVWGHYVITENFTQARLLFENYSVLVDRIDGMILKFVREKENIKVGREYIRYLNECSVRQKLKERAYGTLLNVLVSNGMYDDAVELILEAEDKKLGLEKQHKSTLTSLKKILENENKPVPFNIPSEESLKA